MQSELTRGYEAFRAQDLGPTAAPGSHVAGQRPAGAGGLKRACSSPHGPAAPGTQFLTLAAAAGAPG